MKPLLVGIVGPTAVGKSKVAIEVAMKLDGEIISADSMQVYRGMDIGTAKITKSEAKGIPHHLIDIVNPDEPFSVADFQKLAKEKIYEITTRKKLPLLVGGTGLYVNAVTTPYKFQEHPVNMARRAELADLAKEHGVEFVHKLLAKVDPELAEKLHPNDIRRVIRGIEYFEATGEKISRNQLSNIEETADSDEFNIQLIGLTMDRHKLYQKIEARIDEMINQGLVTEVKTLLTDGFTAELTSLQGLGYKEIVSYLQGKYDIDEAIRLLKRNTRRFAKRQLTWFKRDKRISWYDIDTPSVLDKIVLEIGGYLIKNKQE